MPACDNCGTHVSDDFRRVFGDHRGRLFACPACAANAGIAETVRHRRGDAEQNTR